MVGPIIIELEVDEPPPSAALNPLNARDELVTKPAAAAVAPAAPSPAGPTADVPPAPVSPEDARDKVLRIVLGQEEKLEKLLQCTQDDVSGFVWMSYIAGGFPLVIDARRAIEQGVEGLAADAKSHREGVTNLEELAADTARSTSAAAARDALPAAYEDAEKARKTLREAQSIQPLYGEYFRRAWNTIATYEETLLRQYDRELRHSFLQVAASNRKIAEQEWIQYKPVGASEAELPFAATTAEQVKGLALSTALIEKLVKKDEKKSEKEEKQEEKKDAKPEDKKEDKKDGKKEEKKEEQKDPAREALDEMWRRALKLYDRAKDLAEDRRTAAALSGKEDKKQQEQRLSRMNDRLIEWNKYRHEIADDFPVLLKVYANFTSVKDAEARRPKMNAEIVDALIATRDECDRIALEALVIWAPAERLRIVPEALANAGPDAGFSLPAQEFNRQIDRDTQLRSVLDATHVQAATHFGLTIPVSEIFAALLSHSSLLRKNTGWMHAPVGWHLMNRAATETSLAVFFESGTIAHAAVSQVLDRVAVVREREKTWKNRGMMLMWGAATLLAFFTKGATLYGAALVQAAFSAHEIYTSVIEYENDTALAAVSLAAIEEAGWRRPATVNLVRLIVADAVDIIQGVLIGKELPLVLDLLIGTFSLLRPEEEAVAP